MFQISLYLVWRRSCLNSRVLPHSSSRTGMASNPDGTGVNYTYSNCRWYLCWAAWAGCTDSASWIICELVQWAMGWAGIVADTRSVGAVRERVRLATVWLLGYVWHSWRLRPHCLAGAMCPWSWQLHPWSWRMHPWRLALIPFILSARHGLALHWLLICEGHVATPIVERIF